MCLIKYRVSGSVMAFLLLCNSIKLLQIDKLIHRQNENLQNKYKPFPTDFQNYVDKITILKVGVEFDEEAIRNTFVQPKEQDEIKL